MSTERIPVVKKPMLGNVGYEQVKIARQLLAYHVAPATVFKYTLLSMDKIMQLALEERR
jgi:hypothetical protein